MIKTVVSRTPARGRPCGSRSSSCDRYAQALVVSYFVSASLLAGFTNAAEINRADLPPPPQVERALNEHLLVRNAASGLKMEQANQRKWNSGTYEFNLRAGSSQRNIVNTGQKLKEWDVALERPLRLINKVGIDENIGSASVQRAEYALGDAHHEAGRLLLKLWFNWQREQANAQLWQKQLDILNQQSLMTEKRVKAGDAPKLELNLAQAAAAQASVAWHQAQLRAQLAGNDLARPFPAVQLPEKPETLTPVAIEHDFAFWKSRILADNHELAMVQAHTHVQQLLAERSRADRIPDPTVGLRYSNEMGGNEKVAGVYLTVPISSGHRSATAEGVAQQAAIAADQESFVKRRLEGDIFAAHLQALKNFSTWQQARDAAQFIRSNAELVARAYTLGEASLSDSLNARRIALESSMAENIAQLDANEAHYRLLLDAHLLWAQEEEHLP
ncbi:MAG: TolC family protein [Gallionella sp.]|nr:TolC family protein [Gallionella sp.]